MVLVADGAVCKIRQDAGAAVVMHHLAGSGLAVFQQRGVLGQGDDPPLEQGLAGESFFKVYCIVHLPYAPFPALRRFYALSLRQSAVCCQ